MSKNSETWKLRYLQPTQKTKIKRILPSYTVKGTKKSLLSNGEVISREALITDTLMQTILTNEEYFVEKKGNNSVRNRYLYLELECSLPGSKAEDYEGQDFDLLERNRKTINFYKFHNEVTVPDGNKETNTNQIGQRNYELTNLDKIEADKVSLSELENRLIGELHEIYRDEEQFLNVAYMMGINPAGVNRNTVFNMLSTLIKKDYASLLDFEKKMNRDEDRWTKTVINRALRTVDKSTGSPYIEQDINKLYTINGNHVASNYVSLVAYMKDNTKLFKGIEESLGMKASGRFLLDGEQGEFKKEKTAYSEQKLEGSVKDKYVVNGRPKVSNTEIGMPAKDAAEIMAKDLIGIKEVGNAEIGMKVGALIKKIQKVGFTPEIAQDVDAFKTKCGSKSEDFTSKLNLKAKEAGVELLATA